MISCACNNKECKGICREANLERPRKCLQCCPAANGDGYFNGSKERKENGRRFQKWDRKG